MSTDPQVSRFRSLARELPARWEAVRSLEGRGLVEPDWRERNATLVEAMLPQPPLDFIRHPVVRFSMFMPERVTPHELPALIEVFGDDALPELLREDAVGDPPSMPGHDGSYTTSSNRVHHLYHLARFRAETGSDPADAGTVVEWGGGYGNLARLFTRLRGGGGAPRYVLIDTPLFACVQWLYLASLLGPDRVRLLDGDPRADGADIHVVPVGLAERLDIHADLFISTWALNESSEQSQKLVLERDWFGAPQLLLGMHDTDPFLPAALERGARQVAVGSFMPHQSYALR